MDNRNGNGRFRKGQSGNPKGRPVGTRSPSDALRRRLAEGDDLDNIADMVIQMALKGERWCVELVFDRMDGKPLVMIDIEQRIRTVAIREGLDPDEAVIAAQRVIEEAN